MPANIKFDGPTKEQRLPPVIDGDCEVVEVKPSKSVGEPLKKHG